LPEGDIWLHSTIVLYLRAPSLAKIPASLIGNSRKASGNAIVWKYIQMTNIIILIHLTIGSTLAEIIDAYKLKTGKKIAGMEL